MIEMEYTSSNYYKRDEHFNPLSLSHDFSYSIRIGSETQSQTPYPEGSQSIGVGTLKIVYIFPTLKEKV